MSVCVSGHVVLYLHRFPSDALLSSSTSSVSSGFISLLASHLLLFSFPFIPSLLSPLPSLLFYLLLSCLLLFCFLVSSGDAGRSGESETSRQARMGRNQESGKVLLSFCILLHQLHPLSVHFFRFDVIDLLRVTHRLALSYPLSLYSSFPSPIASASTLR